MNSRREREHLTALTEIIDSVTPKKTEVLGFTVYEWSLMPENTIAFVDAGRIVGAIRCVEE